MFERHHQRCANKPAVLHRGEGEPGRGMGRAHPTPALALGLRVSRTRVRDPQHSLPRGWCGAEAVPDSVAAAALQSQTASPCPLGLRQQAGARVRQHQGTGAYSHAPGRRMVGDGRGICTQIIPSLPAPPARVRHLSQARADVTLQDPSRGVLTAPPSFFQGQGDLGPLPRAASRWIYDRSRAPASRGQERQWGLYGFHAPF